VFRQQALLYDWQEEEFAKICKKYRVSKSEMLRISVSLLILEIQNKPDQIKKFFATLKPNGKRAHTIVDIHFEARKTIIK
jgi:hypothetical protein